MSIITVSDSINHMLPAGKTVKKIHISSMSKMGRELTEAWAIATAIGITEKVEKPLFIAVQKKLSIKSVDDIKAVFNSVGVSPEEYDSIRNSLIVQSIAKQQEVMAEYFDVRSTPTFYVKGCYQINNNGFKANTPEEYVSMFSYQVIELSNGKVL